MKKTMKKILCSLLIVVMCLTAAPLQGFIDLDWSWLSLSAKAISSKCGDGLDHELVHTMAKESDCYIKGNYEYWYCIRCQIYFKDEYALEAFSGQTEISIEKRKHDVIKVEHIPPTCEENGFPAFEYCRYDDCHYTTYPEIIPDSYLAYGHHFVGAYIYDTTYNCHSCLCINNCGSSGLVVDGIDVKYSIEQGLYIGAERCTFTGGKCDICGNSGSTDEPKGEIHYSNHTNLLNAHMVKVVDKSGNPIGDATVTIDGQQHKTAPDGTVHFTTNAQKATIGVIKNGYLPINNDKLEHTLSQTGSTLFVMYEIGDNTPYNLQSAVYSDSLHEVNVLYGIKRMSLKNESSWIDNGKFNLKCVANVPSAVYKYELWQNKTEIAASTDGEFTGLEIGDFKKGGDVKVRVYKDKKNFISNSVNLKFEEDKKIEGTSLSLGGSGLNLSFDDSIPYLGGSEVSIDFPDLPIEVYMETGENGKKEVHVGVNAKLYDAEKEMNGKWSKNQKESWKEQVNKNIEEITDAMDILKKYKGGLTKTEKNKVNKAINNNDKSNIPGLDKCSISFIGYGKGEYIEGVKESVEIDLYVIADLQGYGMTQQFMVWIVPFVVDIKANLGLSSEVKGKWDILNDSFAADWKVNIKPSLEAFAGPGVGKVVNVGATGEAVLDVEVQLLGTNTSTGVNSVDLEGSLGISATFGIFEFKKNFMKDTWHLYTRKTKSLMYAKSPTASLQEVYDLDGYALHDLSYLENESEWISQPVQTYSRMKSTNNATYNSVNTLLSNTYKNMQPMIVTTKDNAVVSAFLWADTSRNIYNAPIAVYSVYDSETNSWATPVPFDNNDTSDSVPYLYTDGNDIYAVYLDSSEAITENDSIDDYAIKQNVTVAKYNKATGGFDSIEVVENAQGDFKANPQIAVIDNIPTVVWQSNNNDPFGLCNENTIYKSEFIDGSWSDKQVIVDNQNGIVGLATDLSGLVYMTDGDNNFATTADRTIYLSDNYEDFIELESGVVSNPVFSEDGKLFWYSSGTLKTYEDEIINLYPDGVIGFTDKFDVISDKVYYIGSSDEGKNLFVLTYDENTNAWTAPVQITNQTKDIDYFTVGNIGGQTIATMTLRDYTITEDVFEDTCDLAYVILEEKHDVKIEYVDYEYDDVVPSSNLPLTVGVTNNGSTELEEFEITVSDVNENLVYTSTYQTALNPGESSEYIVEMPLGEEITLGNYKVVVNETEHDDADLSNNSKEITIGYCNFEVTAEPVIVNDVRYAIINVTNKSYTKSTGKLNIYNSSDAETPVDVVVLDELAYGESVIYQLPIDSEILGGDEGVIAIKAISDVEQYNSYSCQEELYFDISTSTIIKTYNATWLVDDEEEIHTYEEGDAIEAPEDPQKDGFYFIGWTPSIPETMPAEDITFTAQWLSVDDPKACELFGCKYTAVVTPATCTTQGYTTYTCDVCEDSYVDDYINKLDHEYVSEITTPATHIAEGVETFTCECGDSYTKPVEKLEGHTYETVVTAPTCTEKGFTTYTCECGDSYVDDYANKLDHKYTSKITTPSTHLKEGIKTFTCECGDSYTEPVAKLDGHTYEAIITDSTCTEQGYITNRCSCGDSYIADYIAAKEHCDNNNDGRCDDCAVNLNSGEDNVNDCSCNCHKTGIVSIIWKILRFFYKLFKINPICGCGVAHW